MTTPADQPPAVHGDVLVAVLTERLENLSSNFTERLIRIESKLDAQVSVIADRDIRHVEHKADVDKRLSTLEKQLEGYRNTLRWLMGTVGALGTGVVLGFLKSLFHW